MHTREVAVDTETYLLHPDDGGYVSVVSVAFRNDEEEIVSEAYPFAQWGAKNLGKPAWDRLCDGLGRHRLVMHNAKFDLTMLRAGTDKWWGVELVEQVIWDTMVAQGVLDPLEEKGLKETAARLWGEDERESEKRLRAASKKLGKGMVGRYDAVDWSIVKPYAKKDAELTLKLAELQWLRLEEGEGWARSIIEREMKLLKVLYRMEQRGIGWDLQRCREAVGPMQQRVQEALRGLPFKPTPVGAQKWFFGRVEDGGLGLIPHKLTPTGKPSVDEDVLRKLMRDGRKGAKEWSDYARLSKALSMWYEGWTRLIGDDGRLRTVYSQTSVVSMRLSCSRIQLMAIPHNHQIPAGVIPVRKLFKPQEGHKLIELDLSQAEVRVATSVTKCRGMRDVLIEGGEDVHGATARRVFGVEKGDKDWNELRIVAKRLNFAMIYGAGARTLREQIREHAGKDVSEGQCIEWIGMYREAFPEFYRESRRAEQVAQRRGYVRLAGGRLRWFREYEYTHKAFNQIIQGSVAEIMKDWMVWTELNVPGVLLLQIHDSMVLEVPESDESACRVAEIGQKIFEREFQIPFVVDIKEFNK